MKGRPFLLSGAIGIAVIAIGLIVTIMGLGRSTDLTRGFFTPVLAFEFATGSEDIQSIFFDADLLLRDDILSAMTKSTYVDFLFLVLYGAFLFTFSIICASLTGNPYYGLVALLAVIAPLFDVLENIKLLSIMEQFEHGGIESELRYLYSYTWVKWGALTLVFLLLIPFFLNAGKYGRFLSLFAITPFILGLLAFLSPGLWNELFAQSIFLMFLFMIVFSFTFREDT